jgi:hypothetical protein
MSNHLVNKALLRPIEPGVPAAGEIACRALAAVWSGAARRVCGHAPDIARFAHARPVYPQELS